ncbi:MAG: hypothetical protein IPM85_11360 [Chitinophagaceae bacterium]|nr:hypothetical protein [Chitinophagaceae bacterium]
MKKLFFTSILICATAAGFTQLTTTLVVAPQPPASLISWTQRDLNFIVVNQSGATRQVKIKTELKTTDGTIVGSTNLAKARIVIVGFGNDIFSIEDVFSPVLMQFTGKVKTSLDKTGKLPADNYQLCVKLVTPTDFVPISEEKCRNFTIAALQLAIPVMPANETTLKPEAAQSVITFRWTPVAPQPSSPVTYRLLVFEVLDKQTPMQALRSNLPLLQKEVTGITQYIWQPQLAMLTSGETDSKATQPIKRTFIWTLQCLDSKGQPLGDGNINGDGISEPAIFYVGKYTN